MQDIMKDLAAQSGFKTVEINGKSYTYELMDSYPALLVGGALLETFLPAFGAIGDGIRKKDMIMPEEDNIMSEIALQLATSMGKTNLVDIVKQLLFNVTCGSTSVKDISKHFKGNLSGMILLVEDALKENFGELFLGYCKAKGFDLPSLKDLISLGQAVQNTEELPSS